MHKGTIDYLFDLFNEEHFLFQESWELNAPSPEEALKRLQRIAQARLALLASNVRIARVTMPGQAGPCSQRVSHKGLAGPFAYPWGDVLLRRDGRATQRGLRGVPKEIYSFGAGLSGTGVAALRNLNNTLRECQCMATRNGAKEPIGELQMTGLANLKAKSCKKAQQTDLIELLGREEGLKLWEERKTKKKQEKLRRSPPKLGD